MSIFSNSLSKLSSMGKSFVQVITDSFVRQGAWPENIQVQTVEDLHGPNVKLATVKANCNSSILKKFIEDFDKKLEAKEKKYQKIDKIKHTSTCKAIRKAILTRGFGSIFLKNQLNLTYSPDAATKAAVGDAFTKKVQKACNKEIRENTILKKLKSSIDGLIDDGEFVWILKELERDESGNITKYYIDTDYECKYFIPCLLNDNIEFGIYKKPKANTSFKTNNHGVNVMNNVPSAAVQKAIDQIYDITKIDIKDYEIIPAENIVYFSLENEMEKIDIEEVFDDTFQKEYFEKTGKKLPKYTKTTDGLYLIAYDEIMNLEITKGLLNGNLMGSALSSEFYTLTFPAKTPQGRIREGMNIAEERLNDFSHADGVDLSDVNSLVNATNHRTVLPAFTDGKNALTKIDLGKGEDYDKLQKKVEDLKGTVAALTNMDPLIFGATNIPTDKNYYRFDVKFSSVVNLIFSTLNAGLADLLTKLLNYHHDLSINPEFIKMEVKEIAVSEALNHTDTVSSVVSCIQDILKTRDYTKDTGIKMDTKKLINMINAINNTISTEQNVYEEDRVNEQ